MTIDVLGNDSDPEGTPLTVTGTSTTNGTAVISGTNVVFRAATNFNGVVVLQLHRLRRQHIPPRPT